MALSCQIEIQAAPAALHLDLTRPQDALFVATVSEICNSPSGYTVTLSSRGNGRLQLDRPEDAGDDPSEIPYYLRYGEKRAALRGSAAQPAQVSDVRERTGASGVRRELWIGYRPPRDPAGGAYSDVLVFTITPR